jgi:hypothetical protein
MAKESLKKRSRCNVLADKVSITLLLLRKKGEVLLNLQADDGGWLIRQVVLELLGLHVGC